MVQITFSTTEEIKNQLAELAAADRRSMSQVIGLAVEAYLAIYAAEGPA
jgi:predicted transcriptional regulator